MPTCSKQKMGKMSKTYRPLPDSLTIGQSKIEGLGLFAIQNIDSGVDLGLTHIPNCYYENGYIRTPLGGFINHSDTPNCKLHEDDTGRLSLRTVNDIVADDEITVKYNLYTPQK